MTAGAKPEPKVGIFWLIGGQLILDTRLLSQVEAPRVRSNARWMQDLVDAENNLR
jgi:hypothetical protein